MQSSDPAARRNNPRISEVDPDGLTVLADQTVPGMRISVAHIVPVGLLVALLQADLVSEFSKPRAFAGRGSEMHSIRKPKSCPFSEIWPKNLGTTYEPARRL